MNGEGSAPELRGETKPSAVLVRFPNWIGDVVMALPVLDVARRLWPEAHLGVQIHPRAEALLAAHPAVQSLHPAPSRGGTPFHRAVASVRSGRYDLGVTLAPSFSSAWVLYLAGIPRRIGWTGDARRILLTDPVTRPARDRRITAQYQDLFRNLGWPGPELKPRYEPPRAAVEAAHLWLSGRGLAGGDFVALAPGAQHGPAKRWPAERFRELAAFVNERGLSVVLVGSPAERALLETVGAGAAGAHILSGDLDLAGVAAVLGAARSVVANDSGLLHLARAVGTPVVGIYGSSSPAWTGYDVEEGEIVRRELVCSPCFQKDCPLSEGRYACLERITVSEVGAALDRLLARAGSPR